MKILSVLLLIVTFIVNGQNSFVIGVEELDYYPHYSIKNKEYVGFAREVFDAFAKEKGYKFTYKPLPIKRLYSSLVGNEIDFKFPDSHDWGGEFKKDITVSYSKTLIKTDQGVIVLKENLGKNNLKTLGMILGFTPFEFLDLEKAGKLKIQRNPSLDGLINQALFGRIDGVYINLAVSEYLMEKMGKKGQLVHDPAYTTSTSEYKISSIKHPKIIKEFDLFMVEKRDLISALVTKYKIK